VSDAALCRFIEALLLEPVPVSDVPAELQARIAELGLVAERGCYCWPQDVVPLDAASLAIGGPATVLPAVDSTNRFLREQLAGDPSGAPWQLVTAECQTAGRGRLDRHWLTPLGGSIAVSMSVPLAVAPIDAAPFSLVVGLAVLESIDPRAQHGLGLKWPNDINAGDAKVGGILIEAQALAPGRTTLVVGVGLNYRKGSTLGSQLGREVTDLGSLGVRFDRNEILGRLRSTLQAFADRFEAEGFEPFRTAFDAVHVCQGRRCQVILGTRADEGLVSGVGPRGALILDVAGDKKQFEAGEVSLRPR
jgi:BirA family biotin operon repressor/biotin-[acetyl-CoA-carboxylase] ligase